MTQTPEPLDLDAVQQRWELADCRDAQYFAIWNSGQDVPDLIAEIRRLQRLLHVSSYRPEDARPI
jgi:hypothetical protein